MNPAAEVIVGAEELNEAALAVRAAADARQATTTKRRNILSVQGCSGCGRPRKQRVRTPFGMRSIFSRLKMTLLSGVVAVLPPHASSSGMPRRTTVQAPLCKSCRQLALHPPVVETGATEQAAA